MEDRDARIEAVRRRLAGAPGVGSESAERLGQLVDEFVPFLDAADRAEQQDGTEGLWREARSLAWLFAYRAGDQGFSPLGVSAVIGAWRDAAANPWAQRVTDEVHALAIDAFARAREDQARATLQRSFGEALPVAVVAPRVVLVIAAGPLDIDAARTLVERAGKAMLRADARSAVLALDGVAEVDASVISELLSLEQSATMLGAALWVCGAAARTRDLNRQGARDAATLAEALDAACAFAGVSVGVPEGWVARALWLLTPERKSPLG